jgi:hypothetical protein
MAVQAGDVQLLAKIWIRQGSSGWVLAEKTFSLLTNQGSQLCKTMLHFQITKQGLKKHTIRGMLDKFK